ncbi:hypothetical protein M514_04970 [Trichuris suis]|uniref:Uncharacterized protein n=1 Tax=Trichuris suis TaxID=68888 RepID=A0A085NNY6_9BILA|nr:hypothetical protein M513_04970 [Trichuris suis]KFD71182.1 hypothetical protein M514_04970 [Trichuris suis]
MAPFAASSAGKGVFKNCPSASRACVRLLSRRSTLIQLIGVDCSHLDNVRRLRALGVVIGPLVWPVSEPPFAITCRQRNCCAKEGSNAARRQPLQMAITTTDVTSASAVMSLSFLPRPMMTTS